MQIIACATTGPFGCAAASAALTLAAGGSIRDALIGAALAFVQTPGSGSMSAWTGVWGAVGDAVATLPKAFQFAGSVVTHAVVGGALSMAQGGSFLSGAAAGAVGAVGSGLGEAFGAGSVGRVVISAVAGGTASVLTGGKFANGAITAAFATMFNEFGIGTDGKTVHCAGRGCESMEAYQAKQDFSDQYGETIAAAGGMLAAGEGAGIVIGRGIAWAYGAEATASAGTGATAVEGIEVGGGASLRNLAPGEITRIQNAANRFGTDITVVGSRASGRANPLSDWDFITTAPNKVLQSLPRGDSQVLRSMGRDPSEILRTTVNKNQPYITFSPKGR